jgi:very-short-patch-repair endonuclease
MGGKGKVFRFASTSPRGGEVGRAAGGGGGGCASSKEFASYATYKQAPKRGFGGLRNRGLARWKFRRQHPIDRYVVDFVTLDGKLMVEVDGVTHRSESETLRDAQRTLVLDSLGFRVIRVTNVDIYENLAGVLEMIYHELCHD